MKKSIKVLFIIMNMMLVFFVAGNNLTSFAWSANTEIGKYGNVTSDDTGAAAAAGKLTLGIANIIRTIGTGIALIMISWVAIKYMTSAPEERAEFKKSATALVVGAIIVFAGANIVSIIAKFAGNIS